MRILLCCSGGYSSGFFASQVRKAAKEKNLDVLVQAKSASEIGNVAKDYDIICIGPHVVSSMETFKSIAGNTPVIPIPHDIYSMLNGKQLLQLCINTLEEAGHKY